MAIYRVSYLYSQNIARDAGWSENFYLDRPTFGSAREAATGMAKRLSAIHGRYAVLDCYRISNVAVKRDSQLIEYQSNTIENISVADTVTSDYPTTALLIESTGVIEGEFAATYRTRQWIKGLPDSLTINGTLTWEPGEFPEFARRWKALATDLADDGLGWRMRVLSRFAQLRPITVANLATGEFTIPDAPYVVGNRIRILGVTGAQSWYFNREWKIRTKAGDVYTFWNYNPPTQVQADFANANARLNVYVYPDITQVEIKRITKRDVGRPFAVLSGRRRRRR